MATGTSEQRPNDQTNSDWQVGKDLGACMKELYARNLWTDVRFRCKDHDEKERIHAHKIVLAARSPVFQAMFYGACAEAKNDVKLKDAESNIFDLFLRYVYTDNVLLEEEDEASDLLQMAHLYQVPSLVQLCADYLEKVIKIENVCELLTVAEFYRIKTLKGACYNYIDQNATAVINSCGFMELSKECLLHILKGDTFYTAEETIVAKIAEWAGRKLNKQGLEQNGANVRNVLGELFYYLRLPTLSYQKLVKCTRNKGYLSTEEFMNISDFINHIPSTSVTSNSTVARVPMTETLIFNVEDEEDVNISRMSCSLEILVSGNVKLLEFKLRIMTPYLKSPPDFYKCTYTEPVGYVEMNPSSLERFSSKYIEPCKTVRFLMENQFSRAIETFECEKVDVINVPHGFVFVADGSLDEYSSTHSCNFKFYVSNTCSPNVVLTKPFVLKKSDTPYRFRFTVEIPRNYNEFRLKMQRTKNEETIISKAGNVSVFAPSHSFLESIKIQSLANRFEDI